MVGAAALGGTAYVARACDGHRPPLRLCRRHLPAVRYRAATRAGLLIQVHFYVLDDGWPVSFPAPRICSPEAG
jgi:hypothetical protein